MNWNRGLSAQYFATEVDPKSWQDIRRFEIKGGTISRSDSSLIESADIDCDSSMTEQWIRIYLDARQGGTNELVPLFTGLAISPDDDIDGTIFSYHAQCYSVLKPAEDVLLQRGWYAPVGIEGAKLIKRLLGVTPAPVEIEEGSPSLKRAIIAEDKESHLSMAWKILDAIGWRFRITGDGTIHVCPKASSAAVTYDPFENDSIEPQLTRKYDWYGCPNVFRATQGDSSAVARDESSFMSVENRGREVWMEETNCNLNENETLLEYAKRRLKEEQSVSYIATYDRRYNPDILVGDLVRLHYPVLDGVFEIKNQSVELGYGARTSEEVHKRYDIQ